MELLMPERIFAALTSARLCKHRPRPVVLIGLAAAVLLTPDLAWASGSGSGHGLVGAIGISILAATVLAYLGYLTKQPLLLAYIAAGAAIGQE